MYILKTENRVAVKFYLYAEMSTENGLFYKKMILRRLNIDILISAVETA
jgi:hypothetical protein